MENSMVASQNFISRTTIWSSNSTSGCISKRCESWSTKRHLYTHGYSNVIHNSQKVGATQLCINRWMDKQNLVYTYHGILFSLKKERNSDVCCNMDETGGHYAKWNKPNTGWFHFSEASRIIRLIETESRMVVSRAQAGRGKWKFVP